MAKEQTTPVRIKRSDYLRLKALADKKEVSIVDVVHDLALTVSVPVIGKLNKKTLIGEIGVSNINLQPVEEKVGE